MTGNGLTESTTARSAWFGFSGKENELWNAQSSTSHWVRGERYQYFGARYYDPVTSGWQSSDLHAEISPAFSSYIFCNDNPIILVDPMGTDVWRIDENGRILNRYPDKEKDVISIAQETKGIDANNPLQIVFEYGTLKEVTVSYPNSRDNTNTTLFAVKSEREGADLFKFLADNTYVEHGLITTSSGPSFVTTDHRQASSNVVGLAVAFDKKGFTITSVIHSHPKNTIPSGFKDGDIKGDRFQVLQLKQSHGYIVNYYVYQPKYNGLVLYDENQIYSGLIPWNTLY